MKKISVVVPVYNVQDYLAVCLDSILQQQYQDFEIIIVDDGSTDNSGEIARQYAENHPSKIRLISQDNKGLGGARNTGIEAAAGEYLLFVDSDDQLQKDALKSLAYCLEDRSLDMVIFDIQHIDNFGRLGLIQKGFFLSDPVVFSIEKYPQIIFMEPSACNKLFRRDLFVKNNIRFPAGFWYEDVRTTTKLYLYAKQIQYLNEPLYLYLQRSGSIMHTKSCERNREIIDALDDVLNFYQTNELYAKYKTELEYLTIYHVYLTGSVRVIKIDRKNVLLFEFRNYVLGKFPNYQKNRYVQDLSRKEKLILSLLDKKCYILLSILLKIKNSMQIK